jgi:hypothetical protein
MLNGVYKVEVLKKCGRMERNLHVFLTSIPDGGSDMAANASGSR